MKGLSSLNVFCFFVFIASFVEAMEQMEHPPMYQDSQMELNIQNNIDMKDIDNQMYQNDIEANEKEEEANKAGGSYLFSSLIKDHHDHNTERKLADWSTSYSCNPHSCSCGKGCSTTCYDTCYTYYNYCTAGRYSPSGSVVSTSSCTAVI